MKENKHRFKRADLKSFLCLYLAPKVMDRKLHYYHGRNHEIHALQTALIEQAHALVLEGRSFRETAHDLGLQYRDRT